VEGGDGRPCSIPNCAKTALGTAVVKQVFQLSKFPVAGCSVLTGRIVRNARARVGAQNASPIYRWSRGHAQNAFQDDAGEVRAGLECGIRLGDFNDYLADDTIECYQLEKFTPESLISVSKKILVSKKGLFFGKSRRDS